MSALGDLLNELDTLSDIITGVGVERKDPIFFGLSSKLDDVIEKYNSKLLHNETNNSTTDDTGC